MFSTVYTIYILVYMYHNGNTLFTPSLGSVLQDYSITLANTEYPDIMVLLIDYRATVPCNIQQSVMRCNVVNFPPTDISISLKCS